MSLATLYVALGHHWKALVVAGLVLGYGLPVSSVVKATIRQICKGRE